MDYKSKRWKKVRWTILARDRHRCRECGRYGLAVNATVVHHAYPADDFPGKHGTWSAFVLAAITRCMTGIAAH